MGNIKIPVIIKIKIYFHCSDFFNRKPSPDEVGAPGVGDFIIPLAIDNKPTPIVVKAHTGDAVAQYTPQTTAKSVTSQVSCVCAGTHQKTQYALQRIVTVPAMAGKIIGIIALLWTLRINH